MAFRWSDRIADFPSPGISSVRVDANSKAFPFDGEPEEKGSHKNALQKLERPRRRGDEEKGWVNSEEIHISYRMTDRGTIIEETFDRWSKKKGASRCSPRAIDPLRPRCE